MPFALIGPIGWQELIIILFIILLLFVTKKLPDMAKAIGESLKEFRKTAQARDEEEKKEEKKEE